MLSSPCFGYDPGFAQPLGYKDLTYGIVDLVSSRVVKVLTLQPYTGFMEF
jgi:hypothetical protein